MPKHCVSPQQVRGRLRGKAVLACAGCPGKLVQHGRVGILQGAHSPHGVRKQLGGKLVCQLSSGQHSALHQSIVAVFHCRKRPEQLAQLRWAEPPHSTAGSRCDVFAQLFVVLAKLRKRPSNVGQRLRRQRIRTFSDLCYHGIHKLLVRPLGNRKCPHQVRCLLGFERRNQKSGNVSNAIQQSIIRHPKRSQRPSSIGEVLLVERLKLFEARFLDRLAERVVVVFHGSHAPGNRRQGLRVELVHNPHHPCGQGIQELVFHRAVHVHSAESPEYVRETLGTEAVSIHANQSKQLSPGNVGARRAWALLRPLRDAMDGSGKIHCIELRVGLFDNFQDFFGTCCLHDALIPAPMLLRGATARLRRSGAGFLRRGIWNRHGFRL
mmetsp:Transcript_17689/g.38939  ORF Transcript_17689/g.38939 Transcript_17689/m.38939 type:complete len:380 (-) Transcript_17689:583-1722(-)